MVTAAPTPERAARPAVQPRALGPGDVEAAARVFAQAFMVEPGSVALLPDPAVRRRLLECNGRLIVERARRRATAYGVEVDGQLAAMAVWDPPGVRPGLPPLRTLPTLLRRTVLIVRHLPTMAAAVRGHRRAFLRLGLARQRAVRLASRGPSWHLGYLATHPDHQGRGLARALVDRILRRCDDDGLPAWLETTDPANPPIYERLGFTTVAHLDRAAWLPGLWVMRREPQAPRER